MPRRVPRRRLGVEQLESRCVLSSVSALPSAAGLGININALTDYSPDLLFANAMMTSRHWGSPATPWDEAAPVDNQGWPTQDAGLVITDPSGDDVGGTYALSFTGQAANIYGVESGNVQVVDKQYDAGTNTTTAQVIVPAGETQLILSFTGTQRLAIDSLTANPNGTGITDVVLMRPEVTDGSTPYPAGTLFTTGIENLISNFQVIRFMDYSATNNNPQVNWSDRTLPSAATQQSVDGGAWEYAVALANATNKDMWINIPEGATPQYVTDLAELIAYGSDGVNPYTSPQANPVYPPLNSNLKVYFEYSNEVWNYNFPQATANQDAALAEAASGTSPINYDGTTNTFILTMRRVMEQTVDDSEIFRSVFGDADMMTRIRPVFSFQYNNESDTAQMGLDFLNDYYNNADGQMNVPIPEPPSYYLWGAGGAWYATVNDDSGYGDVTVPDGGFESPVVADYQVAPAGSSWTFTGAAGIAGNVSSLGNPAAPEGVQAAFLQATGSFSESVDFSGGYADISFSAAQLTAANESFEVLYDGTPIGSTSNSNLFTPSGTSYQSLVTIPFETTAGEHTITFVDMGGGGTALVDDVQVQTVNAMYDSGIQDISSIVATESAWATAYGLQMVSYEGGFYIGGDKPTALQILANLDPRAQAAEAGSIDEFFQNGGELAMLYDTTDYSYELTGDLDDLDTPKLEAIYTALAVGLPDPTIGTTLPTMIGQSVTIPEMTPGYTEGNETNAATFLVQTTAPGTFSVTFQGSQGSPDTTEEVMVDGQIVPAFESLPSDQGISSPTVTFSIALPGLHAITLLSNDTPDLDLSGDVTITAVAPAQTLASTASVATSPASTVVGQSVTLTATVSAAGLTTDKPTGSVIFLDGLNVLGSATISLVAGVPQASLTLDNLAIGSHLITAVYTGDLNFSASLSPAMPEIVDAAGSTISLTNSSAPVTYGQGASFLATVAALTPGAGVPTGTVAFYDGNDLLGTAPLLAAAGLDQASFTTEDLPGGSDSITAVYSGDANFTTSKSTAVSQSISQAASAITATSGPNPAGSGQSVLLTAVVSSTAAGEALPTGCVTFYAGGDALGMATLSVVGGLDEATLNVSSLPVGYDSITARYSGDTNFLGSMSAAIVQGIGPVSTAITSINFEDQAVTGTTLAEPLVDDGYAFTSSGTSAGNGLLIEGTGTTVSPGGWPSNVLMAAYWGTTLNFAAAGGGTFNLLALDVDVNYQAWSAILTAYDAHGNILDQTAVNFVLGNAAYGTATLDLGWLNVSSVSVSWWQYFDGGGAQRFGAIDNLLLSSGPVLPTVTVSDAGGTYSGAEFPASDSVAGVGSQSAAAASLEGTTPSLAYYSGTAVTGTAFSVAPTTAGTYTVVASFAGSTDYVSAAASTTFTIDQADPTVSVTDDGGVYSGLPYGALATVNSGASLESVTPSLIYFSGMVASGTALLSPPSTVGTYTVLASFAGSTDYASAAASATFSISQAMPGIAVTDSGGIYSGSAFPATARVNNQLCLEGITPVVVYYSGTNAAGTTLSGVPSIAGTYIVLASFAGSNDYTSAQASTEFSITQAMPTVGVVDSGGTYSGASFPAAATVNSNASLEGSTPGLSYFAGTSVSGSALSAVPSTAGTFTVLASFAGSTDYTSGQASATFTIDQAMPVVCVSDAGGVYTGSPYAANSTVNRAPALESVTPTLTYYSGTAVTGTPSSAAPSTAGAYTVLASFVGSTDYTSGQASSTFTITQAAPTVGVSDVGGVYSGATFPAMALVNSQASLEGVTPSLTYFAGTSPAGTLLGAVPSLAGTYAVVASFAGSTDYSSGQASATFTIGLATPLVSVSDSGGVYDSSPYAATACVNRAPALESVTPTLTYYCATAATGLPLSAVPSTAGTYTVLASFAGSADYTSGQASATFSIAKAVPTVGVSDAGGIYSGGPFAAAALVNSQSSLEGVSPALSYYVGTNATGMPLSSVPSTAGTYTVLASYSGSTDYSSGQGSAIFTISRANPLVGVSDGGGTYSGSPYPATATVNLAAALESVTPTLTYYSGTAAGEIALSAVPSAAGTYTVLASFAGSLDYSSGQASATFSIAQATPLVSVSDSGGTYSNLAYPATATVQSQASLESVTPMLTYYSGAAASGMTLTAVPSTAGTYTVLASFAGSTDYTSADASTTYTINRAVPTIAATASSRVFNGSGLAAGDSAAGISHMAAGSLETVTPTLNYYAGTSASGSLLPGAPSTVGAYAVVASFAGSTDYASAAASTTFSITLAVPTLKVTDASGSFTGSPFVAMPLVTGVSNAAGGSLEGVTPTLSYFSGTSTSGTALSGAPSVIGTYAVFARFAGSTDYTTASASTTFSITKAAPLITLVDNSGPYTVTAFTATTAPLEGVTPTLAYYSGTSAAGAALSAVPSALGTYLVVAKFAGSQDYSSGATSVSFSIVKAIPTLTVTDAGGPYSGSSFTASDSVAGVGGQSAPAKSLEGVTPGLAYYSGTAAAGKALGSAPSLAGTYVAVESFAGSTHYTSASVSAIFTISRAVPTVSVSASGGVYDGKAYSGSATVAGVNKHAGTSLESVTPTLTYYSGTVATGTPLGGAPSAVGAYTAVASFAGSTDYAPASAWAAFTITAAGTKTTLTSSASSPAYGASITLTATLSVVSPGAGTPTGAVQFYDGATPLGSPVSVAVVRSQVTAQLAIGTLGVGAHSITAVYQGSVDFQGSTSSAVSVTVGKQTASVSVTLSANPDTGTQPLTFTVTVKPASSGAAVPTGIIAVTETYQGVKSALMPVSTATVGSDLVLTFTLKNPLAAGTYSISASYSGDANYAAANGGLTQVVK